MGTNTERMHVVTDADYGVEPIRSNDDSKHLKHTVYEFVASGLRNTEGVLLIVSRAPRETLWTDLLQQGIDIESAMDRGQLRVFDAHEALSSFMLNRMPEETLRHKPLSLLSGYPIRYIARKKSDPASRAISQMRLIADLQQKTMDLQNEVAERRSIERALLQSQDDLLRAKRESEMANEAKSQFLATMSHEIRTPLAAILGFTELLMRSEARELSRDEYLDAILRNAKFLSQVVDDILDLTKLESHGVQVEPLSVSLESLLAGLKTTFELGAREKGLGFHVKCEQDVPEFIVSDPRRLQQILFHVVGNAIKFTQHGSIDIVVSYESNRGVNFTVTDTGLGISPNEAQRLFQPFVQADSSTTRKFGGIGLGLALSRRLAWAIGGDLVLERSKLGRGSTFVLSLSNQLRG
jgi:signal transduction histidine kinase